MTAFGVAVAGALADSPGRRGDDEHEQCPFFSDVGPTDCTPFDTTRIASG